MRVLKVATPRSLWGAEHRTESVNSCATELFETQLERSYSSLLLMEISFWIYQIAGDAIPNLIDCYVQSEVEWALANWRFVKLSQPFRKESNEGPRIGH